MTPTKEQRIVFAIGDDKETVILGIPEAAWEFMKNGMTHTFDLRSLGVPIRLILFGGKDWAACLAPLKIDKDTLDVRGLDFGFGSSE